MATRNGVLRLFVLFIFVVLLAPLPASAAGSSPTTTTLASSATNSTITLGDTVTFTATVAPNSGTGTPTGMVTFFDGSTPLGSGTLSVVGGKDQATFSTSLLAMADVNPPPHQISAVYQGDATFAPGTSAPTLALTVQRRSTTTGLALNPTTVVVGQPSTTTATATDAGLSFPPGTANTFATTGAPATGRSGFTATLFADGQVLVAGGTDANGNVLQSAEIYSVSGAAFTGTSNLNTARTGALAVLLPNGKVLIAGGSSDGTANGALDSAELFDPVARTFTLAGNNPTNLNHMTAARFGHTATLLNNGQVLIAGGQNSGGVLNSAELYDPVADTFASCGNLSAARTGAVAILLRTGAVLIAGGSSDGAASGALNTAEVFSVDSSTGAGTAFPISKTLSAPRWQAAVAPLPPLGLGNALIVGGQDSGGALASGDLYNIRPFPGTFQAVSNQMTVARSGGSALALPNGEVLLAGGSSSQVAEVYDSGSGKFERAGDLLQSDNGLAGVLLNNGQVLMVGLTTAATPASDAELYSTAFPPLGQVDLSSTVAGDTFGSTCVLVPGSGNTSTCTSTVTPAGMANPDFITATYQTDTIHDTNSGTANLVVNPAATMTLALVTTTPTPFGQPIGFSAMVFRSSPDSTAAPTGAVQFVLDGINFGAPVPLFVVAPGNSEADTPVTIILPVSGSPHSVGANYINSDGNFVNSSDSFTGVTITPATTATAVVSSQNPSSFGQAVTFTATVADTSVFSTAVPTGTVQFAVDGVNLGSPVTLTGASAATSTAVSPADNTLTIAGSPHLVTATYVNADGNFINSNGSLTPGQSVTQAGVTVIVTPSSPTITVGDTVTFTATVTSNSGSGTPTGLVTFFDGKTPLGSGTLNAVPGNDQATFSTSLLPTTFVKPPRSITAIYDGDLNFTASAASLPASVTVNLRNTTTSVAMNPATALVGQSTTATVTVNDTGASSPPGAPDVFSPTGAPLTGRTGFSSALFADGQVLVAGGTDASGNVLQSSEIYSVSGTGFVATKGNLNAARTGALAVLLPNGKVLVAGGSSDGTANGALGSAELFDPFTGTFTPTSHNMTAPRFAAMATLLGNGLVLLSGGDNSNGVLNTAELYNPATDSFAATGNLNTPRTGASSTLLENGQVLIAGGSSDGTASGALNTAELFDPAGNGGAGAFTLLTTTLSAARWQPQAASAFTTDVLIAGGQDATGALTSADLYAFGRGLFFPLFESMAVARANGSAVTMSNGRVLLVGGAPGNPAAELFDTINQTFVPAANLLEAGNGTVATLLNNGQVLAVGLTSGASPQPDAELYSPSFNPSGFVILQSADLTQPRISGCHLAIVSASASASTCGLTFAAASLATNPDVITANAALFGTPDGVHLASKGSANLTLTAAATTSSVGSSVNPSDFGQPVTFTTTVTDSSPGSAAPPTGAVQFVVDGVNFGSPVNLFTTAAGSSAAVLTTSALGVSNAPHTVTANFVSGDGSFVNSSGSLSGGQTVTSASTTTALVSSVPSPTYGQGLTFTATITNSGTGSAGAPTGSVQFVVDGQNFGTPVALTVGSNSSTATSGSIATLTVNGGSPHAVAANYLNTDQNFANGSGLLPGGLQVSPAHLSVTATSQSKTYDAATSTGFSALLTGFVTGETDAGLRGSGALSGAAAFTGPAVSAVNAGVYVIAPAQGTLAASNYDFPAAGFASGTLTILKANTASLTTEAATPLNDPVNGGSVSFVVVVTSTTGGTPTGSVQLTDDKNTNLTTLASLSTASCPSGTPATASCAKFNPAAGLLAVGSQTITASYQGDANFNSTSSGSTPSSVEVTVLSAINTNPGATIPPQVITFENGATLAAQNLTLSCVVQAAAIPASSQFPTCSLSATSLPQSGSVTVSLTTAAPTTAALTGAPATVASTHAGSAHPNPFSAALGLPAIGFLGLVLLKLRRNPRRSSRCAHLLLTFTLLLSIFLLVMGCGGGGNSTQPHTVGGTPTGTYLVSVVGSDANHNPVVVATIPLNVQ